MCEGCRVRGVKRGEGGVRGVRGVRGVKGEGKGI